MARRHRKRRTTNDAFSNTAARLGYGTTDLTQATTYEFNRMTEDEHTLTALYRGNWIVANVCEIVPQDIIRKWFEVRTAEHDTDVLDTIFRRTQFSSKLKEGLVWGRLYGGAAGIMLIKGHDDLSLPLDLKTVLPGSFMGIYIVDRWTGIFPSLSVVKNPSDPEFGLPEYYNVRLNEQGGTIRVHHSRVLRFCGRALPLTEKIANEYWGESEIEAIYEEITSRDNMAANITALTFKANVEVRKVDGLNQILGASPSKTQEAFWNALTAQAILRSSQGIELVDKNTDVQNEQYTFAGLGDIYDRKMMDVSGASRIPVTKLFGRSAAGMNSTGENDLKNYYDYVDGVREVSLRPVLEKSLPVICMSAWGEIPKDLKIVFPPMETPDEEKTARICKDKVEAVIETYQSNLIDKSTALKELRDIDGIFEKLTDEQTEAGEGVYFTSERTMNDPLAGVM